MRSPYYLAALRLVLCVAGSVALGHATFGGRVLQPKLTVFQFVASGIIAGAAIAVATVARPKALLAVFIAAFLATSLVTKSEGAPLIVRDAVYVAAVVAAVRLCLLWDRVFPRVRVGKFVLWSAVFGMLQLVAVVLLEVVLRKPLEIGPVITSAGIGALIGAGVGIGYELSGLIGGRGGATRAHWAVGSPHSWRAGHAVSEAQMR